MYMSRYGWKDEDDEAQAWTRAESDAQEARSTAEIEEMEYKEHAIRTLLDAFAEVRAFLPLGETLRMVLDHE